MLTWIAAAMTMMMQPTIIGILRPNRSLRNGTIGREAMEPMEYMAVSNPRSASVGVPMVFTQTGRSWEVFIKDLDYFSGGPI